jgi:hypothetical protein
MGTMDLPAAGAPAYAPPRGARSESGRSTYSRRSRSARAAAAADENMPASRFIYVDKSYKKYCEALAWAKDQVRCRDVAERDHPTNSSTHTVWGMAILSRNPRWRRSGAGCF